MSISAPQQALGADSDELEQFSAHLVSVAARLDRVSRLLAGEVRDTRWTGSAAVNFRSEWRRTYELSLRQVTAALRSAAEQIREQAQQQRLASSSELQSSASGATSSRGAAQAAAHAAPQATAQAAGQGGLQNLYQAHRQAIATELQLLRAQRADWLSMSLVGGLLSGIRFLPFDPLQEIDQKVGWLESLAGEQRQFLFFDTTGGGHVAEVFGQLDQAQHVTVLVPGVSTDPNDFARPGNLPAARLQLGHSDTAAIQWLGYDPPHNLLQAGFNAGVFSQSSALAGAVALQSFVASLRRSGAQDITVIGHSLGAYLASVAAGTGAGLDADRLVLAGSPGSYRSHVEQLQLRAGPGSAATVFSIEQGVDPISTAAFGRSLLGWEVADPDFGATRLVDGQAGSGNPVSNHSRYFTDQDSLQSLVEVIRNEAAGQPQRQGAN